MKDQTRIVRAGRVPPADSRFVNPPVYHASTVLFETMADVKAVARVRKGDGVTYGVHGTPGTFALEEAVCEIEGGYRTRLCSTGGQAIAAPLLALLSAGDHFLYPDCCYDNLRDVATGMLARFGVEAEPYDPLVGGGIRELMRPNTRVVFVESPGSQTFEVQDIPAIADVAHSAGAWVVMDNTWAGPLYFRPFEHGVDVSIQALTKYVAGHADLVMGAVTATEAAYERIQPAWHELGCSGAPDDAYLALRGLRTMGLRLERHWQSGLALGEWLLGREEVAGVVHPAMPHDPGFALWERDFVGAGGLFGFWLEERWSGRPQVAAFLDGLELFGMGFSWGSYQSMILYANPHRPATTWPRPGQPKGQLIRIYAGLEDVSDLTDDLAQAFERMRSA